jgi:hypothetical protein
MLLPWGRTGWQPVAARERRIARRVVISVVRTPRTILI